MREAAVRCRAGRIVRQVIRRTQGISPRLPTKTIGILEPDQPGQVVPHRAAAVVGKARGGGTPAWISPSCPVPAQLMGMPDTSKGSVYPVISTGAGNAGGTAAEIGQGPETSTGPFKRTSTLVAGNGAGRGAAKVMKTLSICRPAGPTWRTGLIRACQPQAGTWQPYVCPHPGWLVLRSSVAKQVSRRGQEFHTHFSRLLGALDTLRRKGYCRASTRSPC